MSDEVAKLEADLEALNLQCQLARDHEIRYALQRTRLETQRVQLLVKLMDARAPPIPSGPLVRPKDRNGAEAIVAEKPGITQPARRSHKPNGLPSWTEMVLAVLEAVPEGLRPREITAVIRRRWWPQARPGRVNATAWSLVNKGLLENTGGRYRLNGHAGE
jgi:hypothetical protein